MTPLTSDADRSDELHRAHLARAIRRDTIIRLLKMAQKTESPERLNKLASELEKLGAYEEADAVRGKLKTDY